MTVQLPLITGKNVRDLFPENVYLILVKNEICVSLYQKGWQFSCTLITGRNVKDLSSEIFYLYLLVRK